jgi:hypothetical protein
VGRHRSPLALLAGEDLLPAVRKGAGKVELLGVERSLDLPTLRLPDRELVHPG